MVDFDPSSYFTPFCVDSYPVQANKFRFLYKIGLLQKFLGNAEAMHLRAFTVTLTIQAGRCDICLATGLT